MFGLFKQQGRKHLRVGVEIKPDGVALVCLSGNGNVRLHEYAVLKPTDDPGKALGDMVRKHHLQQVPACVLMPEGFYSLLQLSSPVMGQAELRASMRWRVKDLVAFSAEESVVDVFEFPESGQRGNERMLYVVAARSADVRKYVEQVRASGLDLQALDIGELALRNVVAAMREENEQGVVLLYLEEAGGLLVFIKASELYLARRLEIGLKHIRRVTEKNSYQITEQIQLELQRSLDYFERQFVQPLPGKLLVFPGGDVIHELLAPIQSHLRMEVVALDFRALFPGVRDGNDLVQPELLLAMGAALRQGFARSA